jgi:hypothetical protein
MPVAQAARLFELLADETWLRLLPLLAAGGGDIPFGGLPEALGLSQQPVSHHLRRLRLAGAVTCRREGNHHFYALAPGPPATCSSSSSATSGRSGQRSRPPRPRTTRGYATGTARAPASRSGGGVGRGQSGMPSCSHRSCARFSGERVRQRALQ